MQSDRALAGGRVGGNVNPIWAGIRQIVQSTWSSLTFRFACRKSTMLNALVDQVAGRVRQIVTPPELGEYHDRRNGTRGIETINPKSR